MLPLFNPRDVRSAALDVVLAAQTAFPAPATSSNLVRYLLGAFFVNRSAANVQSMSIRVGAVDVFTFGPWLPGVWVEFPQPIEVGQPGANALTLFPINGAAQDVLVWVQFADVRAVIAPEIFRS